MMQHLVAMVFVVSFATIPLAFADQTYKLQVDDKAFDVQYGFDGTLISMDVDKQSTSLLVGVTDVKDSQFTISFPTELLAAQNNEFVVLVDGLETDYSISQDGNSQSISFQLPEYSEEIEIIGTSVIPEFPFGALAIMGIVTAITVVFSMRLRLVR